MTDYPKDAASAPAGDAFADAGKPIAPAGNGVALIDALRPFALIAPYVENADKRDGDVVHRQLMPGGGRAELTEDDFRIAASVYAAALVRPRAAVGEQSREAIARAAADGCDDQYPEGRRVQDGEKWWAAYDGAMRALALQSPPAKE